MKIDYMCPKCRGHLKIGDQIILTVKKKGWSGGMILMHPELGNYKFENHPSFMFEEGDHLDFYCPICMTKLTSKRHENLCMILMRDENNQTFEILFSRIKGEKSTYKIIGETRNIYGRDSNLYVDFISLSHLR